MEDQQVQNMIEAYIKNNLRVLMETDYSYSDNRQQVTTRVFLGDDEIDSDYVYIDKE